MSKMGIEVDAENRAALDGGFCTDERTFMTRVKRRNFSGKFKVKGTLAGGCPGNDGLRHGGGLVGR
jgi:hypothetical protein